MIRLDRKADHPGGNGFPYAVDFPRHETKLSSAAAMRNGASRERSVVIWAADYDRA